MILLQQYKHWVRRNSNLIGAVEGALSSLIWFLPDRFSDSELSSEALQSLLGLLALYHESVLQEPASARDQKQPVPWQMWLGALQQVEVLVEMAAQSQAKQGNMSLYTPLTAVEAVKSLLRLLILRRSGDRLLTDGGVTSSDGTQDPSLSLQTSPEMRAQAVYGAFANFRAHHCLRATTSSLDAQPAITEAEKGAVSMLQHVAGTAGADDIAPGGLRGLPSQQSDMPSLASTKAPQGSAYSALNLGGHRVITKRLSPVTSNLTVGEEEQLTATPDDDVGDVRPDVTAPDSPSRQHISRDLSSHPLPPSPGGSLYWWDLPQEAVWREEDAQSELESESSITSVAGERLRKVQAAAKQQQALASGLITAGELAYICRPLAYVLALRFYGQRSWKPWLLSLLADIASSHLSTAGAKVAQRRISADDVKPGLSTSGGMLLLCSLEAFRWTPIEQRELTRRKLLIMYYLIRSPFFDRYTKGIVDTSLNILRPVPLIGALADKAGEILYGVQQYYTYTSAS